MCHEKDGEPVVIVEPVVAVDPESVVDSVPENDPAPVDDPVPVDDQVPEVGPVPEDNPVIVDDPTPVPPVVFKPASERKCDETITLDLIKGRDGKSWKTTDPKKKIIDKFRFNASSRNGHIRFRGTTTGRKKFHIKNGRIISSWNKSFSGFLTAEGNIMWSNGYTSEFNAGNMCPCKLILEMLTLKKGRTWNTSDLTRKTTETIRFS